MTVCDLELQFDFLRVRPVVIGFSELELSSDAGILLAKPMALGEMIDRALDFSCSELNVSDCFININSLIK
jgi:hypothetical protein